MPKENLNLRVNVRRQTQHIPDPEARLAELLSEQGIPGPDPCSRTVSRLGNRPAASNDGTLVLHRTEKLPDEVEWPPPKRVAELRRMR